MKKKYLMVAILLMFIGINTTKALEFGDCKVLASYKLYSSLDEENYICKDKVFGKPTDAIYYSGEGNTIRISNINAYYFTSYDKYDVVIDINGKNNIELLHVNSSKFTITGSGSLKFKEDSFVKKVENGEAVYRYSYNGKTIVDDSKKIYKGTNKQFEEDYLLLKDVNKLPEEYDLENFKQEQIVDYTKMTPVVVTESWMSKHITTELKTSIEEGFGVIEYVKPATTKQEKEENKLETENVVLISDKKVNKKYKLNVFDLKEEDVAKKVEEEIEDSNLIGLYDVSVYNGKKEVSMKNGSYTIKIKLDDTEIEYDNYQIIYVNDNDEIEEYISGTIEDGYIVFKTTHLSQYGIIANNTLEEAPISVVPEEKSFFNAGNVFKISILLVVGGIALFLIIFLVRKSNSLKKKSKKKKRFSFAKLLRKKAYTK